jgi:hypothetical protein
MTTIEQRATQKVDTAGQVFHSIAVPPKDSLYFRGALEFPFVKQNFIIRVPNSRHNITPLHLRRQAKPIGLTGLENLRETADGFNPKSISFKLSIFYRSRRFPW